MTSLSKQNRCLFILSESSWLIWMGAFFKEINGRISIATYDFHKIDGVQVFPLNASSEQVATRIIKNGFSCVVLLSNQSGLMRDLDIATQLKRHHILVISQGPKATRIGIDKIKMKQFLVENGFPIPDYRVAFSIVDAFDYAQLLGFPLLLKVANLSEGRKMSLVNSNDEIAAYYYENAISEHVILEKFIYGREVSTIVYNNFGAPLVFPVIYKPTTDYLFKSSNTRDRIYVAPQPKLANVDQKVQNLALNLAKRVNNKLLLGLDIVLNEHNEPFILEFNARVTETLRMSMILVQINILENLYFIKQEKILKNHSVNSKGFVVDLPVSPNLINALKNKKIKLECLTSLSNTRITLFSKSLDNIQKAMKQMI